MQISSWLTGSFFMLLVKAAIANFPKAYAGNLLSILTVNCFFKFLF